MGQGKGPLVPYGTQEKTAVQRGSVRRIDKTVRQNFPSLIELDLVKEEATVHR